jgi:hypothetical protein
MATIYVDSNATGSNDGSSWSNAFTAFTSAISALSAHGDIILISHLHSESLTTNTTLSFGYDCKVLSVDTSTGALTYGASLVNTAIWYFANRSVYFYGLFIDGQTRLGNPTSPYTTNHIFDNCTFDTGIRIGHANAPLRSSYTELRNCKFANVPGNSTQIGSLAGRVRMINCSFDTVSYSFSSYTTLFAYLNLGPADVEFDGCDFSAAPSGTILFGSYSNSGTDTAKYIWRNCKLPASANLMPFSSSFDERNRGRYLQMYNCSSGDTHYHYYFVNSLGEVSATTEYYADDGAQADVPVSYKVTTTESVSDIAPFVTDWFAKPHNEYSSITASIEGLRISNTTVFQSDEVWAEFTYQGTSGSTLGVYLTDKTDFFVTAVNQTSTKTYADWTGDPTDTTSGDSTWKAEVGLFTPQENGFILARIGTSLPSTTFYFDPQIRIA